MKKLLMLVLIILMVIPLSACGDLTVFGGGTANVKDLCEGSVQDGTYRFSMGEEVDIELTISGDSATLIQRTFGNQTSYVNDTTVLIFNGTYKLKSNGNVVFTAVDAQEKLELVGTEENIAEYVAYHTELLLMSEEEYQDQMALLNGEAIGVDSKGVSLTARLDIQNGKMYIIEYNQGGEEGTVSFKYHPNGVIKTAVLQYGLFDRETIEYDEYGYDLSYGVQREYYENGMLKREEYPNGRGPSIDSSEVFEYNEQGQLISVERDNGTGRTEYYYNEDGVLVLEKVYGYKDGEISLYDETEYLSYSSRRTKCFDLEYYTFEEKEISYINEYWNSKIKRSISFCSDGDSRYYDVRNYNNEGSCVSQERYDADGVLLVSYNYNDDGSWSITEYYPDGQEKIVCECPNERPSAVYIYNVMTEYNPDGSIKWIWRYDENGEDEYAGQYYDPDGNPLGFSYIAHGEDAEGPCVTYYRNDGKFFAIYNYYQNGDLREYIEYGLDNLTVFIEQYNEQGQITYESKPLEYEYRYEYHSNGQMKRFFKMVYISDFEIQEDDIYYDERGNVVSHDSYISTYDY